MPVIILMMLWPSSEAVCVPEGSAKTLVPDGAAAKTEGKPVSLLFVHKSPYLFHIIGLI